MHSSGYRLISCAFSRNRPVRCSAQDHSPRNGRPGEVESVGDCTPSLYTSGRTGYLCPSHIWGYEIQRVALDRVFNSYLNEFL